MSYSITPEELAHEKFQEYTSRYRTYDPKLGQRLIPCLVRFYEGRVSQRRQTLSEIVQGTGLGKTQFSRVLRRLGEETDYKTPRKGNLTSQQKQRLELAVKTPFSNPDISYFLNMNADTVYQHYRKKRITRISRERVAHFGIPERSGGAGKGKQLTYSLSSKILERMDRGLSKEEIVEELEILGSVYNYVKKNKAHLGQFIIYFLSKIFPEKEVVKPYITGEID